MPPSPALRISPGREPRTDNNHKRGHSFESGLAIKAKDDDLALFNDMQTRERDNFLLHTTDDFDDSLSKLRYFSDHKLGITIPARGGSSDLLNAEGEKNDYDWLLTPPDTPLFSSLDDDETQQASLISRGRQRSQPIAISRSSINERNQRTPRSSASPRRLSPSPRSSNSGIQSRGNAPSAPYSSPSTVVRPTTPSRRPSTPPNKPLSPTPRSSTPTPRRMSTGSSGRASSAGRRGVSPVQSSRGNSASPKLRGWQSSLPGFSSDAPPNLRTSLSDRPSSHTRGLSPASRDGRKSMSPTPSGNRRQSMSPSASRSASSSQSHEHDCFSSYSKGSAVSSGDDDLDSLHSMSMYSQTTGRNGMVSSNRAMAFSKKPSRTPSASSAPKRSFDSALRQMDHHRTPPNMFRPLLSSVPTTTFYVGKASNMHRPMFSRNSSLTTSSNASSEQGIGIAPDIEASDHDHNDVSGEWEKARDPDAQEDVFMFDKVDEIVSIDNSDVTMANKVDSEDFEKSVCNLGDAASIATASESSFAVGDPSQLDSSATLATCSKCGNRFHATYMDGETDLCQECAVSLFPFGECRSTQLSVHGEELQSDIVVGRNGLSNEMQLEVEASELPEKNSIEVLLGQQETIIEQEPDCLPESSPKLEVDDRGSNLPEQLLSTEQEVSASKSDSESTYQQPQQTYYPSRRVESPEGTGISVLLQRSNSSKWPVVEGKPFSATNLRCSDPSYTRDFMNVMKRSFGRDSSSASSSVDLGSSRQTDVRVQRQLSNRKGEMENMKKIDFGTKVHLSELSVSRDSNNSYETFPKSEAERSSDNFVVDMEPEPSGKILGIKEHDNLGNSELSSTCPFSSKESVLNGDGFLQPDSCMVVDSQKSELTCYIASLPSHSTLTADHLDHQDQISDAGAKESLLQNNGSVAGDIDVSFDVPDNPVIEEENVLNGSVCRNDISDAATTSSSEVLLGSLKGSHSVDGIQGECTGSHNPSSRVPSHEGSVSPTLERDLMVCSSDSNLADHVCGINDEPDVKIDEPIMKVEVPQGHMSRSLTLEEATDTILFCSSIIHDLAYKAASMGMEKESYVPPEASRPTVTILGNPGSNRKDSRTVSNKRTPNTQKAKRKRMEASAKPPVADSEDNAKVQATMPIKPEIPNKVDNAKPPKLESKCNCTIM